MLAALMLAGLAAVAMVPIAFDHLFDDDDSIGDDAAQDVDQSSPGGEMLPISEDVGVAAPAGVQHDIPAVSGEAVLAAFDPACDHCTLAIDTWDSEIVLTDSADAVSLTFSNAADGIVTVRFPGLSEVPVDSISVCVDAPGEGGAVSFPLSDIFAEPDGIDAGTDPGEGPGSVLSPTDPDAPDDLPDPIDIAAPLGPIDPDAPDQPPADPWQGEGLAPVVEDDMGGSLIWGDPATGAPLPAVIAGFESGDLLSITLSPAAFPGPLDVTVLPAGTGGATTVLVDGQPVALVTGPAAPEAAQIRVSVAEKISR
jgi:hypothetical protein